MGARFRAGGADERMRADGLRRAGRRVAGLAGGAAARPMVPSWHGAVPRSASGRGIAIGVAARAARSGATPPDPGETGWLSVEKTR